MPSHTGVDEADLGVDASMGATLEMPPFDLAAAIDALLRVAPRCAVAGDVGAAGGLGDLIAFVHQNRWSGTLRVLHDDGARELHFRLGEVRGARSSRPEDRLGALLFRYGRLTGAELAEAVDAAREGKRLGQVLIERGRLGSHDLFVFVKRQVEEIFYALLSLRAGRYAFERLELHEAHPPLPELGLSTRQLLFEAARRTDELLYFKERIPSAQAVPVARAMASNLVPMDEDTRRVLGLVDGQRSVEAIGRESRLGEVEATRVLVQLMASGRVELARAPDGHLGDPRGAPRRRLELLNDFLAAVEESLDAARAPGLLRAELASFLAHTTTYAELFRGVRLGEVVRIDADQVLANLSRSDVPDPPQHLQRGLHELLSFLLFVLGDTLGLQRQQQLGLLLVEANRTLEREARAAEAHDRR